MEQSTAVFSDAIVVHIRNAVQAFLSQLSSAFWHPARQPDFMDYP